MQGMLERIKNIDNWFVRQFDVVGFYLQASRGWHIIDIWKFGIGGILSISTAVMLTSLTDIIPLLTVTPYAIMWGFYLAILLPWFSRQKRAWSMQKMVWWFFWAERLRVTFPPLRLFILCAVLVFAFGPSIGNYVYGFEEGWLRFALTVARAFVMPGGVIFATYLLSIHPVPPGPKVQESSRTLGELIANSEIAVRG